MTQGISLNDYTNSIKAELEALPEVHEAKLFCGQITEEDIAELSLQPGYPTVLVSGVGGKLNRKPGSKHIECDAAFGIYVIADIESNSFGYSPSAIALTEKIVDMIAANKIGRAGRNVAQVPELLEMSSLPSPVKKGSQYATWYCIFTQRITLRATT